MTTIGTPASGSCGQPETFNPPVRRLRAAVAERGPVAYLLTVNADHSPHCTPVVIEWHGDVLTAAPGPRSLANLAARSEVSLLWPPPRWGQPSLIVDVVAELRDGGPVTLRPTRAILHPTPGPGPEACAPV
jgi:hypothetical protein